LTKNHKEKKGETRTPGEPKEEPAIIVGNEGIEDDTFFGSGSWNDTRANTNGTGKV